jgi:carbon dioxide concentrating mechanism protein CcmO
MNEAIGMIETRGYTGLIEATDAMVKAANVKMARCIQIGGSFCTAVVQGDVGSVRAAVEAGGKAARQIGELMGTLVIPNPHEGLVALFLAAPTAAGAGQTGGSQEALGMIETKNLIPLLEATDTMLKAAHVTAVSWDKVGSGYVTTFIRGDVAAVKASVEAGVRAASAIGQVILSHVIPRPHEELPHLGKFLGPLNR